MCAGLVEVTSETSSRKQCVGAAIYVYDHEARDLSRRLTRAAHDHHDLSLATLHVHLDHESCLEITVLRGEGGQVRHFADHVIAERGVRYGRLVIVPVETATETHNHGGGANAHPHLHVKPR